MAGLALFLLSLLVKLLLISLATVVLVRVVGWRLAGRFSSPMGRMGGSSTDNIIAIDNPAYRSVMNRAGLERVISIS